MRLRTASAVAILALTTAFQSTRFDGCGGGGPPTAPLPPSDEPTCISDEDCPIAACEDRRCIAGVCTVVSSLLDRDGDGEGPPPCGIDCDDSDGAVGPGEDELCDNRDQDCDGVVDEEAPPGAVRRILGLSDQVVRASAFGTGMVVLETGLVDGLSAISIDFLGTAGATVTIEDGDDPDHYDVVRTDDGARVVTFHASTGDVLGYELTPDAGGDPVVAGPVTLITGVSDVVELRAFDLPREVAGETTRVLALAWRDSVAAVFVWSEEFPSPIMLSPSGSALPDLATDGTSIVATRDLNEAVFLDFATGAEVASQSISPSRWGTANDQPIDSENGRIVAVVTDAFDRSLTTFTSGTLAALRSAPSSAVSGLPARIDAGPTFHVLTRLQNDFSGSGVWAWAIDPISLTSVSSFSRDEVTGPLGGTGIIVLDYDVVVSEHGAAVLSSLGTSGTAVTTFACGAGG